MLQLSQSLVGCPVMSLRTGTQVALTISAIINPNNLKIEGFFCQDSLEKNKQLVLLYQDIRDIIPQGLVINDHDALSEPDDLVRLKDVIDLAFELIGKPVFSESKDKLGKVNDYATETSSMFVQKIYISQSLMKSFSSGSLSIDRSRIIEITSKKIVVKDPLQPQRANIKAALTSPAPAN